MESVKTLIDKAAKTVGSRYKLAKLLEVTPANVYDWEAGRKPCPAEDRARMAGIAGEDALQELVRATIEQAKGKTRREQLTTLLGKSLRQTGGVLHTAAISVISLTYINEAGSYLIRCIEMLSLKRART